MENDKDTLRILSLGLDNLDFVYRGRIIVNDPSATEFRDSFLRLKSENGLFTEAPDEARHPRSCPRSLPPA